MKIKIFLVGLILLLSSNCFAGDYTTTYYKLIVPEEGSGDWLEKISNDIITIDTVLAIISSDSSKVKYISSDISDLKIKDLIISSDVNTLITKVNIISNDSVIQDTKILIISNDSAVQDTKIQIISNDAALIKAPTYITQTANTYLPNEQAIGSLSSGIMRVATTTGTITSLGDVLPVANGGTGNAAGWTIVSNDIAAITSSSGLGSWVDKTSSYGAQQAATDGFVVAQIEVGVLEFYTDGNADPTTMRDRAQGANACGISCPVKKSDYWKLIATGTLTGLHVYWIPLGA